MALDATALQLALVEIMIQTDGNPEGRKEALARLDKLVERSGSKKPTAKQDKRLKRKK